MQNMKKYCQIFFTECLTTTVFTREQDVVGKREQKIDGATGCRISSQIWALFWLNYPPLCPVLSAQKLDEALGLECGTGCCVNLSLCVKSYWEKAYFTQRSVGKGNGMAFHNSAG